MTEEKYKDWRMIDGKPKWIVVDDNRNIINRDHTKDELKGLKGFPKEKYNNKRRRYYTDEQLLNYLIQFYKKYGRPPTMEDFKNNSEYPNPITYQKRFGSWTNALKMVGLDVESMIEKGVIITRQQKARFAEIIVIDHFEKNPIDLAGENQNSPCDGICPNNKTYDVKSSKLMEYNGTLFWQFHTNNEHKDNIEIYYLLAFNEDWTKLKYGWRIPGEIAEKDKFYVGLKNCNNMKEYDITDKIRDVLKKYGFFNK